MLLDLPSVRCEGFRARNLFEQVNHLRIARDLSDHLLMVSWVKAGWLRSGEFFVFFVKFRVRIGFAKGFLQNFYTLFGSSGGRKTARPATRKAAEE